MLRVCRLALATLLTTGGQGVWDGFKKAQMDMFLLRDAAASQSVGPCSLAKTPELAGRD
jgi:hypothetical protein